MVLVSFFVLAFFAKPHSIFAQCRWNSDCGAGEYCVGGNCQTAQDYWCAKVDCGMSNGWYCGPCKPDPTSPPSSCTAITAAPTNLQPLTNTNVPAGSVTLRWNAVVGATKYALRVDDATANSWTNSCATINPGDVCNDNITATSYTYNVVAGHNYHWWVHALNNCGGGWNLASNAVFNGIAAATNRPALCQSATISGNSLAPGSPLTITSTANTTNIKNFNYVFFNRDNLDTNNIPKGIQFVQNVTFAITSPGSNVATKTITVNYADVDRPDTLWNNQKPRNIQVNAYFTDNNGGFSLADAKCVVQLSVVQPSPTDVPNCPLKTKGDANCDGTVNIADYAVWQQEFVRSKTTSDADFSRDNNVNLIDYAIWQHNFLSPAVTVAATSTLAPSATGAPTATLVPNATATATPTPTTPPPLSYLRAFLTSQQFGNGNLGGLSGADQKCQTLADAANLHGTFKAWLGTDTVSPISPGRFNTKNLPYKKVDGTLIANNFADLVDDSILSPINVDEKGTSYADGLVYSGTGGQGQIGSQWPNCVNWTSSSISDQGNVGDVAHTDYYWIDWYQRAACDVSRPIYCFEDR